MKQNKLQFICLVILSTFILFCHGVLLADPTISPTRDPFNIEGTKSDQNYLSEQPNENISLYTGGLDLNQTDLYLPGNAGFDLSIQRYYSNHQWQLGGSDPVPCGQSEMSCLGFGWSMHMGIVTNAFGTGVGVDLPVIIMPDGSRHPLYKDRRSINQLVTKELWVYKYIDVNKWELTLTNGTKYIFEYKENIVDPAGHREIIRDGDGWRIRVAGDNANLVAQATSIRDMHANQIVIAYKKYSRSVMPVYLEVPRIDYIIDSCGRRIDFVYYEGANARNNKVTEGLLKKIKYSYIQNSNTINIVHNYTYKNINDDPYGINLNPFQNLLIKVEPPVGKSWDYQYYEDYNINNKGASGHDLLLKTMTYPTGANVTYEYEDHNFSGGKIQETASSYSCYYIPGKALKKKTIAGTNIGNYEYSYDYYSAYPTDYSIEYDSTTVTYPNGRIDKYYFYGWGATHPIKVVDQPTGTEYQYCDTLWRLGQLLKREIYDGASVIAKEENTFQKSSNPISDPQYPEYFAGGSVLQNGGAFMSLTDQKNIFRSSKLYSTQYTSYDDYGNPRRISESGGRTANITYWNYPEINLLGKIEKREISVGSEVFVSSYTYVKDPLNSNFGEAKSITSNGLNTDYEYYADGNLKKEINAKSNATVYENYSYGKPSIIKYGTDTQGNNPIYQVSQQINPPGTIALVTNGMDYTMSYQYDKVNRVTRISPPNSVEKDTIINYIDDDPLNFPYKEVKKGNQLKMTYYYDKLGRFLSSQSIMGVKTMVSYDSVGNKVYNSYPYDGTLEKGEFYQYDKLGRIVKVLKPARANGALVNTNTPQDTIQYSYHDGTNSVTITNENTKDSIYTYASFGDPDEKRLAQVQDADLQITQYAYNALGSLTAVSMPENITRTFQYNEKNQLIEENIPEKGITRYNYDEVGNVHNKYDLNNISAVVNTTTYSYDQLNRLTKIDYLGSDDYDVTFEYDNADNVVKEENSYAVYVSSYNPLNKVISKAEAIKKDDGNVINLTTTYEYNKQGLINKITYPGSSSRVANYSFDLGDRIVSINRFVQNVTYHPSGKAASITYGNQKTTTFTYDDLYRLSNVASAGIIDIGYTYDGRSNIKSINDLLNSQSFTYYYDNLDRINSGNGNWKIRGANYTNLEYEYDSLGNRVRKSINAPAPGNDTNYTYDARKRLIAASDNSGFDYDDKGNINRIGAKVYSLNPADKIISTSGGVQFAYAPNNLKLKEKRISGKTFYHYDENGNLISETDENGNTKKDYIYLNGMLVASVSPKSCDLAVYSEDITFSQNPVDVNQPINIKTEIHDIGGIRNTATVDVDFYDGSPSTGTRVGSGVLSQSGDIDQQNLEPTTGEWKFPDYSVVTMMDVGQSFVPERSGQLTKVSLYLKRTNNGSSFYCYQIREDVNGDPFAKPALYFSYWLNPSNRADVNNFKWIDYGVENVYVTAGQKYWIIMFPLDLDWITRGVLAWGFSDNQYIAGEAGWGGNNMTVMPFHLDPGKDLLFKVYTLKTFAEITYTPLTSGVHDIYTWVDPQNKITELDKKNNIACNFLFTDPTFIAANRKDIAAFNEFVNQGEGADHEK